MASRQTTAASTTASQIFNLFLLAKKGDLTERGSSSTRGSSSHKNLHVPGAKIKYSSQDAASHKKKKRNAAQETECSETWDSHKEAWNGLRIQGAS